ncbi:MAG: recombinase family protein [Oscillospiraceae bacterium]|nr:recombinase family protein [Oscillospiraceae bacterium]
MLNIPRVAQYARFSSDNQRSESIDAQIRAMNQFCNQNHWQIVATYTDEARSATTDNRPEFQKMITDSSKGLFDIVLVHKLDRFSRDRYDSAIYKKKLKKNHVRLCSVLERMDDSPESIMMESVLEGMAEYYSRNLGREVMKGMNETALQCKHTGGCPPLGYCLNDERKLAIEPHEAEAVKIIFQMFADGYGYSKIAETLNNLGYQPKRGGMFGKNSLYEILSNEKYTGVYVFNKSASKNSDGKRNGHSSKSLNEIVRVEGGCPQIISKSLFQQVQRKKAANKRNAGRYHSKEFYLLTGKVVCGVCGKRMTGNVRYSGRNKTRLATYRCPTHRNICKNKELNKDYLDAYIAVLLDEKLLNPKNLKKAVTRVNKYIQKFNNDYDSHHESISAQYAEILGNLDNITKAIEKGILTDSLIQRAERLEKEKVQLEMRLQEMQLLEPITYKDVEHLYRQWKEIKRNTEEFRTFIQQFVKEIRVRPYDFDVVLDIGLGVTTELTETIRMRRGELYEMFESRVRE